MSQLYSAQPNTYKSSCTLLSVSVTSSVTHTISPCSRNVGEVSVPSFAYSVPSLAGAGLHTGRQEAKGFDHSTAGIPVPKF